ncbi:altronate oxidoreductase [Vibrio maritimus]|uniref:Altronate oxidoreductase n=1 Tax=Vibrio maritimus TaxID=990268 RepID=A0A090RYT7_9VIBR|nr:altronate oxidoreductase [Vibrio maritimus]
MVSNTTEAGIVYNEQDTFNAFPPVSFPAKVTQFLFRRFEHFDGAQDMGLIFLPCELIDANGEALKQIVLRYANEWQLGEAFCDWIMTANTFCSTLVDRIVTGNPKDELSELEGVLGYQDHFVVAAEYFYLFVIQGPKWLETKLKLDQLSLNIKVVEDITPYKQRKVGILNGAHTAMVPVAYLCGIDTVSEAINDQDVYPFLNCLLEDEVIPSLDMDKDELKAFKDSVIDRFKNPYIKHYLISIALNSLTKFKTRLLPQLIAFTEKQGTAPRYLALA